MPKLTVDVPPSAVVPDLLAWATEYTRALLAVASEIGVIVVDRDERLVLVEGALFVRLGLRHTAFVGRELREVLPSDAAQLAVPRWRRALAGESHTFEYATLDGEAVLEVAVTPLFLGGEEPVAALGVARDVSERRRVSHDLSLERQRREIAQEMAGIMHFALDVESGTLTRLDGPAMAGGAAKDTEPVVSYFDRIDPADRERVHEGLARVRAGEETALEYGLMRIDGTPGRVVTRSRLTYTAEGRPVIIGASIDVTEARATETARRESETLFRQGFDGSPIGMALTDPRTGRYLRINDAYCGLVERDRSTLLTLTPWDITHPDDVAAGRDARRQLIAAGDGTRAIEKRYLRPDGSAVWVSVHLTPVHGADGTVTALYSQVVDLTAQKQREAELVQAAEDRERLERLRRALDADRLVLYAQPIIDVASGEIVQHELLVRMLGEDGTVVAPSEFLPVAERYGLISEVDEWVLRRGIAIAASGTPVEINLSAASVGDPQTLETIRAALEVTRADPSLVVFEVTETALMTDIERGRQFAVALRELGCRFALDDFGTGYGTFTYLKHLPIDSVKIDIDFVRELDTSVEDERMVRAIVAMAKDFGKLTVAEGVENSAILDRLRELGVDHAQGFHIGHPRPFVGFIT